MNDGDGFDYDCDYDYDLGGDVNDDGIDFEFHGADFVTEHADRVNYDQRYGGIDLQRAEAEEPEVAEQSEEEVMLLLA